MVTKKVLSIRTKLIILTGILSAVLLGVICMVWLSLQHSHANAQIINIAGRQRMLTKKFSAEQLYQALSKTPNQQLSGVLGIANTEKLYEVSLTALLKGGKTYTDLALKQPITLPFYGDSEIYLSTLEKVKQQWHQQLAAAKSMQAAKGQADFSQKVNEFLALNHQAMVTMNQAVGIFTQHTNDDTNAIAADIETLSFIILLVCVLLSIWTIRSISKPMSQLLRSSQRISIGKLQPETKLIALINTSETGQIASCLEQLRETLQTTLAEMQTSSYQVHLSADQVSSLSADISAVNASEQTQFKRMIESSDELSHASQQFGDIAGSTSEVVIKCTTCSQLASDSVAENIEMMHTTANETQRASDVIQALSSTAESVYGIVDSIHNISDQTNLLALNAAIEAARAGEQGRGFAVVADEVRTLAARTGRATNEISQLIGQLTDGVNNAVESMQRVAQRVSSSQEKSNKTEENIEIVRQLIGQVSLAQEQIGEQARIQHTQLSKLKEKQTELYETLDESRQKSHSSSLIADQLALISQSINVNLERFDLGVVRRDVEKSADEKRHQPRLKAAFHCELRQGTIKYEGLTEDLSLGGACILSGESLPFSSNEPLEIRFNYTSDNSQDKLTLRGKLVGQSKTAQQQSQYHLQFIEMSEQQQATLQSIFDHHGINSQFES
ncbi:methyl-accepting chemotaxis protein [Celerinatantimonas yamalensis]|uniref:Methyl-accepting chemotaxis protein n=1 Tax=Celerinatantimonas yamalensis TaxID=559956 RepID=A0ABW9GCL2_9GAMM